jgi:hypothetical protein
MEELNVFTGLICYHEKTGGIMVIKKASINNDCLYFQCKVLIKDENSEYYFADATYNVEEVLLTKRKYTELIIDYNLKKGKQLSLFN